MSDGCTHWSHAAMSTKCDFGRRKLVEDETLISVGPQRPAHLRQPPLVLPWRDRRVAPEHQDAISSMEIVADLWLLQPAPVQVLQQQRLALVAGVRRRQTTGDLAGRGGTSSSQSRRERSDVNAHSSSNTEMF